MRVNPYVRAGSGRKTMAVRCRMPDVMPDGLRCRPPTLPRWLVLGLQQRSLPSALLCGRETGVRPLSCGT